MNLNPFLKPHPEGTLLSLKVTAPPVDSAANRAVIEFIAEKLGRPKSAVVLIRGETARHKTLLLKGLTPEQVTAILAK